MSYRSYHPFFVEEEKRRYTTPWFDNRGNPLDIPSIGVSNPYMLIANMVNPYRLSGNQGYTDPQRLHRQTIDYMSTVAASEAEKYGAHNFLHYEHMWDMRRLGLICDYNGLMLHSLQLGSNYPEPASARRYHLNRTGGTPGQLEGYDNRLSAIANNL